MYILYLLVEVIKTVDNTFELIIFWRTVCVISVYCFIYNTENGVRK